jgi:hypothetical protein
MKRLLFAAALLAASAGPALARTIEDQVLSNLAAQGYVILEQGYTFLGRLRIVAENERFHREIVVNPGTGEILRDYAVRLAPRSAVLPVARSAGGSSRPIASAGGAATGAMSSGGVSSAATSMTSGETTQQTMRDQANDAAETGGEFEMVLPESLLPMDPDAP